jgi:hypothetical protein
MRISWIKRFTAYSQLLQGAQLLIEPVRNELFINALRELGQTVFRNEVCG